MCSVCDEAALKVELAFQAIERNVDRAYESEDLAGQAVLG